jgi:hypothetical protein
MSKPDTAIAVEAERTLWKMVLTKLADVLDD